MSEDEEEGHYDLVMPFVVTASTGGPYADAAFVAGMRLQQVWDVLESGPPFFALDVEPELVPQLDLVAMHFNYGFEHEPWELHPDEWTRASFTKVPI